MEAALTQLAVRLLADDATATQALTAGVDA
jgi:hypothetical protein